MHILLGMMIMMAMVVVAMTSIITTNGDEEDKKNKNKIPYGIISLSLYVGMNELVFCVFV